MQRNSVEAILGAVVLIVAGAFVYFASQKAGISPTKEGYEITASFSHVNGIEVGTPIKISGIKIGSVSKFELDPITFRAIVHMHINEGVELPTDSSALVESESLLGGKFMSLEPGGNDELLTDGGRLKITQSAPSLEKLLGDFIFSMNNNKEK